MHNNPVMLVILDGFGYTPEVDGNAVCQAKMPNFKRWMLTYPHALLHAAGTYVGLPEGYVGNSEVGHITIGAGRIVEQAVTRINRAIDDGTFFRLPLLQELFHTLSDTNNTVHIMGLLSKAGVHGHQKHMHAYMRAAAQRGIKHIFVHAFLDGRDTQPCTAEIYLKELQEVALECNATIASLHGRFYAMDRDKHWDRTLQSYTTLTQSEEKASTSWHMALDASYARGETDEFFKPILLAPQGIIRTGDGIIFTNMRADRARQLTACFVDPTQIPYTYPLINPSFFATPIVYGRHLPTAVLFPSPVMHNMLKEVLCNANRTIFSIAESEKYAHITYFFNGENEDVLPHEVRHLIPSKPVRSYALLPAMSSLAITKTLTQSLQNDAKDFYLVNYANPDMVGHSGNFNATVEALSLLDKQLGHLYDLVVVQMNGTLFITSDHGKAECMVDKKSGEPMLAHTTNDVPFLMLHAMHDTKEHENLVLPLTELADIAPFILTYMGIPVPAEMCHKKAH
jgi:2,3-bisphosphoglycerate-independent phosphoglycerate mutase